MKNEKVFSSQIYELLSREFGKVSCPLHYKKDYELCIAVILSAQCTDERVNQVTPILFSKYSSLEAFANANQEELEKIIFSTGFYKNKAKAIKGFATKLLEDYKGKLPQTLSELIKLPGIGRKTANVILNEIFGISEGIVVDTHVKRISKVLGLTKNNDPIKIERDLMACFKKEHWIYISLYMIFLGRKYCKAHKKLCNLCPLNQICPSVDLKLT
jgi:endonuclease-3